MLNKREKMGLENENQDRQGYVMHETFKVLGGYRGEIGIFTFGAIQ